MISSPSRTKLYWLVYPIWIAIIAGFFVALRDAPDPAKKTDRIENELAIELALAHLKRVGGARYVDYEAAHVGYAKRGEVAPESRWVVLCDRRGRTALREAVVVQLRAKDGLPVAIKRVDRETAATAETFWPVARKETPTGTAAQ